MTIKIKRKHGTDYMDSKKEKDLFTYKNNEEHITPRTFSINPLRKVYGEVRLQSVKESIFSGNAVLHDRDSEKEHRFNQKGIIGLIETDSDAEYVTSSMAKLKYSIENGFFDDLGNALWTAFTQGDIFKDVRHLIDSKSEKIARTLFTISKEGIYKLIFGNMVTEKGFGVSGVRDIVHTAKEEYINPLFFGGKPAPVAVASIKLAGREPFAIYGRPIVVRAWNKDIAQIEVDHAFYPIAKKGKGFIVKGGHINQVSGLTAFQMLGTRLAKEQNQGIFIPDAKSGRRLINTAQSAYEMNRFAKGYLVKEQKSQNRVDVKLARGEGNVNIRNLYPSCVRPNGYVNYAEFIKFANGVALAYRAALDALGIRDELNENVLIPCVDKAAYFPDGNKGKKVHLSFERAIPKGDTHERK